MSVEAVDECLNRRLIQVTQVRGTLTRFLSEHKGLWVDEAKCIDNDFALYGLYGIDYDRDCARGELFEGLLCVDIN